MLEAFKKIEQYGIHPSEVARVILDNVTSEDPQLRYLIGKHAATIMEARKNMSDREFENMMKNSSVYRVALTGEAETSNSQVQMTNESISIFQTLRNTDNKAE
jgi:hypothetical protein